MESTGKNLSSQIQNAKSLVDLQKTLGKADIGIEGKFGGRRISVEGTKGNASLGIVIKQLDKLSKKEGLTEEESSPKSCVNCFL